MAEPRPSLPAVDDPAAATRKEGPETRDPQQTGPYRSTDAPSEATPPVLPGYEIEALLGRGGMGVVYRARHLALKRTVALKMMLGGGHAGMELRERFRAEAEAVARLQHPHIVQIYEVGQHDGLPYFSLEFVDGPSLSARLRDNPFPPEEAARLVELLCEGVEAAHQAGVIHRDLKPGNILLTRDGTPKVADFGLAKAIDADSGQTQSGQVLGTPSYMAPEQAAGQLEALGPTTDVYALGAILYEMLTGRPPFRGANIADTLDLVRTREPISPVELQPRVPLDLNTICLKCLQKEPQRRYASARELGEDLRRYLDGRPILARRVSRLERLARWGRRNPVVAALSLTIAVLLLLTTAGAVSEVFRVRALNAELEAKRGESDANAQASEAHAQQSKLNAEAATRAKQDAQRETENAKRESDRALMRVGRMNVTIGQMRLLQKDPSGMALSFAEALRLDSKNPDRAHVHRLRVASHLRLATPLVATVSTEQPFGQVQFSADGRFVLLMHSKDSSGRSGPRAFTVADLSTGVQFRGVHAEFASMPAPLWSPGGRHIVHLEKSKLVIREAATGKEVQPKLQTDTGLLPLSRGVAQLVGIGAAGLPSLLPQLTPANFYYGYYAGDTSVGVPESVAFSPDGSQVLCEERSGWKLFDVRTGALLNRSSEKPWSPRALSGPDHQYRYLVSPAARRVVARMPTGEAGWRLVVTDVLTGREQTVPLADPPELFSPPRRSGLVEFSPDGRLLAVVCGAEVYLWDVVSGVPATPPLAHAERVRVVRFSPDGRVLLTGTGGDMYQTTIQKAWFWNTSTGRSLGEPIASVRDPKSATSDLAALPIHAGPGQDPLVFTPRADYLLTNSYAGPRLWRVGSENPADIPIAGLGQTNLSPAVPIQFSPDGQHMLLAASLPDGGQELRLSSLTEPSKVVRAWPLEKSVADRPRFSPDGKRLARVVQGEVHVYELGLDEELILRPLDGRPLLRGLDGMPLFQWAPDCRHLLVASNDHKALWLWDTERQQPPIINGTVAGAWLAADGREGRLLLSSKEGALRVYDPLTGEPVSPPWRPERGFSRAWLSDDGQRVFTVSRDAPGGGGYEPDLGTEVQVWESRTGKAVFAPFRHRAAAATRTVVAPNGLRAATIQDGGEGNVQLWDTATLGPVGLPLPVEGGAKDVAFTPSGDHLRVTRPDGKVILLYPAPGGGGRPGIGGSAKGLSAASVPLTLEGPADLVQSSFTSGVLALVQTDERTARLVDGITGEPVGEPLVPGGKIGGAHLVVEDYGRELGVVVGDDEGHLLIAFQQPGPKGFLWVTRCENLDRGQVRLKRLKGTDAKVLVVSGRDVRLIRRLADPPQPVMRHDAEVTEAMTLPNQYPPTVVTVCGKDVFIWDGAKGKLLHGPLKHEAGVSALDVAEGKHLVTVSGTEVRLWDCARGVLIGKPWRCNAPVRHAWGELVNRDVKRPRLFVVTDTAIQGQDPVTGEAVGKPLTLQQPPTTFLRNSSGTVVAAGNQLWVHSGWKAEVTFEPIAHKGRIIHARFARETVHVLTVTEDGSVRRLDPSGARDVNPPVECGRGAAVWELDDRSRLLTTSKDGNLRVWNLNQKELPGANWKLSEPVAEARFAGEDVLVRTQGGKLAVLRANADDPVNLPVANGKVLWAGGIYQQEQVRRVIERHGQEVRLWNPQTGERIGTALRHDDAVEGVQTLKTGSIILTRTRDDTLRTWDIRTGLPLGPPLRIEEAARPDRQLQGPSSLVLWVVWKGKEVVVWDVIHGKVLRRLPQEQQVAGAEWNGQTTLAVLAGKQARLWDVRTGMPLTPPLEHPAPIRMGFFAWNALYTITTEDELRVWSQGQLAGRPLRLRGSVRNIYTLNQAELHVLTDVAVQRWNALTGQLVSAVPLASKPSGWRVDPPSGRCVVSYEDGSAAVLQLDHGPILDPIGLTWPQTKLRLIPLQPAHRIVQAETSPDGKLLLTRGSDETVQLWDVERGQALPGVLRHTNETLTRAQFLQGGRRVLTTGQPMTGASHVLWDARTGQRLTAQPGSGQLLGTLPEADFAFWSEYGKAAKQVDLASGDQRDSRVPSGWQPFWRIRKGDRILLVHYKDREGQPEGRVWDAASGEWASEVMPLPRGLVQNGLFSPDGRRLALDYNTASERDGGFGGGGQGGPTLPSTRHVRVWDVKTGQPLTPAITLLTGTEGVYHFTPDSSCLLVLGNKDARLWDAATGDPVSPPLQAPPNTTLVRFSADMRYVLLAGVNQTIVHTLATPWSDSDLVRFTQAASGRKLDDTGAFLPLAGSEVQQALRDLDTAKSARGQARDRWGRAEQEERLRKASTAGDHLAALHHLNVLLAQADDPVPLLAQRADLLTRLERWNAARQDLDRALALQADNPRLWHLRGLLHIAADLSTPAARDLAHAVTLPGASHGVLVDHAVHALSRGDLEGCRRAGATLLERFGKSEDPQVRLDVLCVGLLVRGAADPAQLVKLAHGLEEVPLLDPSAAPILLGLAHYRAGRLEEAASALEGGLARPALGFGPMTLRPSGLAPHFLVVLNRRLGRPAPPPPPLGSWGWCSLPSPRLDGWRITPIHHHWLRELAELEKKP